MNNVPHTHMYDPTCNYLYSKSSSYPPMDRKAFLYLYCYGSSLIYWAQFYQIPHEGASTHENALKKNGVRFCGSV